MKQNQMLMLLVAFLAGYFFKQLCGGIVEGIGGGDDKPANDWGNVKVLNCGDNGPYADENGVAPSDGQNCSQAASDAGCCTM